MGQVGQVYPSRDILASKTDMGEPLMPTAEVGNSKDKSEDMKCWLEQGW